MSKTKAARLRKHPILLTKPKNGVYRFPAKSWITLGKIRQKNWRSLKRPLGRLTELSPKAWFANPAVKSPMMIFPHFGIFFSLHWIDRNIPNSLQLLAGMKRKYWSTKTFNDWNLNFFLLNIYYYYYIKFVL